MMTYKFQIVVTSGEERLEGKLGKTRRSVPILSPALLRYN